MTAKILPGAAAPLGATPGDGGVNFSVYSRHADRVDLVLFDDPLAARPSRVLPLVRTADYWHGFVPGCGPGQVYGLRALGPRQPAQGHRFDPDKLLLDPYARAVVGYEIYDRRAAARAGDNTARALRAVVVGSASPGPACLPKRPGREFIYELHVGGFTRDPASGVAPERRGTYAGVIDRIDHLRDLGVTAVELLPIQAFDPQDAPPGLTNYWGYSSLAFFAPHPLFSSDRSPEGPVREFRAMVAALHAAGIRVYLDVVYNHTAEGGDGGPTLGFRGLGNRSYYILERDRSRFANYSGCGNTFNGNHPVTLRLIIESLRYWVQEMGVDGFRFDLASILTRDGRGQPMLRPPLLLGIETDPVLAGTDLIAEAWDAAGLYQVGAFPGQRFAEWNGPFRDDLRRFLRGDEGTIEALMARVIGSPDLFKGPRDRPSRSINFLTCHDGFTLADLVAYNRKHNEANGEENRDGNDHNLSWNCGVEGPATAPAVREVRRRQQRNALALLFFSHGRPMLWMGDEVGRTQQGNNNAYCQDNPLGWFDWRQVESQADLLRFTRRLAALAASVPQLGRDRFWRATSHLEKGDVSWHGVVVGKPDWSPTSHSLAWTLEGERSEPQVHVIANSWWRPLTFELPPLPVNLAWHKVVDTAAAAPLDVVERSDAPAVGSDRLELSWHSVVVLVAR
ncbi:MAG: glycogen debranching protein GlgX [Candidatus Krumholzibacteriia bacterium]